MKSNCSGQKGQRFRYKGSSVKDSGYDIRTQTWMTKKKKQVFKRLYKRASQVQELLVRSRAGIQSPSLDSNQRGPPHSKLPIESVLGPSPAVTYFMVFLKVFGHILWSRCDPLSHSTCTANDSSNMD